MTPYTRAWMATLPEGFAPLDDDALRTLISVTRSQTLRAALTELQLRRDADAARSLFGNCACDGTHICDACRALK